MRRSLTGKEKGRFLDRSCPPNGVPVAEYLQLSSLLSQHHTQQQHSQPAVIRGVPPRPH